MPDAAAQARAQKLLRDVYGKEYDAAKTSAEKTALARKLLDEAAKSQADPASHFVLLRVAKDVAVLAADAETALEAVERIVATYDVDAIETRLECVKGLAAAAKLSSQHAALAEQAYSLVDAALAEDDFEAAARFGEIAQESAKRGHNYSLLKEVAARMERLDELRQAHAEYQKAVARLEESPTDPEANLAAGRYLCFQKGDWDRGVPMLALANDAKLSGVAREELDGADSPEAQMKLADDWWELMQNEQGTARNQVAARARYWYGQAAPRLTGLLKTKAEKRLASFGESETAGPSPGPARTEGWIPIFDGHSLSGWRADRNQENWSVVDGAITARGEASHLYYYKPFVNLELKADVKINRVGNSGLYFRSRLVPGQAHPIGYEVQILGTGAKTAGRGHTGSLYGFVGVPENWIQDDQWFTLHVTAVGNTVQISIDDRNVVEYSDPKATYLNGYVALQHYTSQTQVYFRNIMVKPLQGR